MTKQIVLALLSIFWLNSFNLMGQQDKAMPEIGVVEKLGEVVPMNLKFAGENKDTFSLGQLINKPTVLVLVYFDCPGVCPAMLEGVSDVVESADMELGKDYQIITVSFNPKDHPDKAIAMKKNFLREKSKKNPEAWIYLTGDSSNIHKLTESVGYKFKQTGLDFLHPAVITVLSPEGKITRYLYGTRFLPFDFKMAIIESQKGLARPTVNKVLEFCFNYDPVGKKYVLDVTRIAGIIILFLALTLLLILFVRSRKKKKNNNNK